MSEEGDIDVESAEDVPDIAVEATATTVEDRSDVYSPTVSCTLYNIMYVCLYACSVCVYTRKHVYASCADTNGHLND